MGLDAILKRYFPAVVCLLIAVAAYLQASAMGEIVASSVLLDPSSMPPPPPMKGGPAVSMPGSERSTNAAPILARNPFDSVTGPLDGKQLELPQPTEAPPTDTSDPYADPACDVGKVLLITQSQDPDWSFAAVAGSDGKPQLRRRGDDVGGHTVYWIGWDRVWLMHGGSRCQMQVHGDASKKVAAAPTSAPSTTPDSGATKAPKGSRKVPAEIAAKIHKVSETQFDVERSVVDQILENQSELMRSARIVPEKEGDKVVGIRLFGVRPESLLGTLGLENGDRLQSINGFEMSDPQKALEAYARLRSADKLSVSVNRRGKPMNIDFNIK